MEDELIKLRQELIEEAKQIGKIKIMRTTSAIITHDAPGQFSFSYSAPRCSFRCSAPSIENLRAVIKEVLPLLRFELDSMSSIADAYHLIDSSR